MVNIPRFEAQLKPLEVPRLRAFEAEQAEGFYKELGSIAEKTLNVGLNMYKQGELDKAQRTAAEDVEQGMDISNLPLARTDAQKVYNDVAVNAYVSSVQVDGVTKMGVLKQQYKDNPTGLRQAQMAYIEGLTKEMPAYARINVGKSMLLHAEANYQSVLSDYNAKQLEIQKNVSRMNLSSMGDMVSNAPIYDNPTPEQQLAVSQNLASFDNQIKAMVSNGTLSYSEAKYEMEKVRNGLASNYVMSSIKDKNLTAEQAVEFQNRVLTGQTGIPAIDNMNFAERQNSLLGNLNIESQFSSFQKAEQERITQEQQAQWDSKFMEYAVGSQGLSFEEQQGALNLLRQSAPTYSELQKLNSFSKASNVTTAPTAVQDIERRRQEGNLSVQYLDSLLSTGSISNADYKREIAYVNSPLASNKKRDIYKSAFKNRLPESSTGLGALLTGTFDQSAANKKQAIQVEMDEFLTDGLKTNAQIADKSMELLKKYDLWEYKEPEVKAPALPPELPQMPMVSNEQSMAAQAVKEWRKSHPNATSEQINAYGKEMEKFYGRY